MHEHCFLTGPGHLPAHADAIAREQGVTLINYTEPTGERRHWFACRNKGFPHNRDTEIAVREALADAGIFGDR